MPSGRKPYHTRPVLYDNVFVRYSNRRIYSANEKKYVPVTDLLKIPLSETFVVIWCETGQEITKWAVDAAKHEQESKRLQHRWKRMMGK